jgi:hypothetical protein
MREPRAMQCCMIVTLLAISTNATLIGSVTTTLTRIQAYSNKEQRHREALSAWCVEHQVPLALQQRIHKYYDFAGGVSRQKDKLIPNLPKALAFQLDLFLKRTLFLRTPFFQGCAIKQIMALVPLVTSEHMMPGRIFARAGTSIEGLYLVARGRVLLIKGEQQVRPCPRTPHLALRSHVTRPRHKPIAHAHGTRTRTQPPAIHRLRHSSVALVPGARRWACASRAASWGSRR